MGSYHYVSGIDTSSSASLAAYINSLTYSIEESQAWFTKGPSWKVKNGCFWCVASPFFTFLLSPDNTHAPARSSFSYFGVRRRCRLLAHSHTSRDLSCFNAFSRVDVRVDVKIPGGVSTYVIDLRGERCALSPPLLPFFFPAPCPIY